jgi:hypothetical protein
VCVPRTRGEREPPRCSGVTYHAYFGRVAFIEVLQRLTEVWDPMPVHFWQPIVHPCRMIRVIGVDIGYVSSAVR